MDLNPHFATDVLEAFTLTLCEGHYHMDITGVVVAVVIVVVGVMVVVDVVGLSGAVFVVAFKFESVDDANGIPVP